MKSESWYRVTITYKALELVLVYRIIVFEYFYMKEPATELDKVLVNGVDIKHMLNDDTLCEIKKIGGSEHENKY